MSVVHRLRRPAGNETGRCGFVFAEGAGASSVCVRTEDFKPRSGKSSRQGASDISPGRGPQGRDLVLGVENEIRAEGEDAILGKGANQIESPVGRRKTCNEVEPRSRKPSAPGSHADTLVPAGCLPFTRAPWCSPVLGRSIRSLIASRGSLPAGFLTADQLAVGAPSLNRSSIQAWERTNNPRSFNLQTTREDRMATPHPRAEIPAQFARKNAQKRAKNTQKTTKIGRFKPKNPGPAPHSRQICPERTGHFRPTLPAEPNSSVQTTPKPPKMYGCYPTKI